MKRKSAIASIGLLLCFSFSMAAFAIAEPNVGVRIGLNESRKESLTTVGTHKLFAGDLHGDSTNSLYFHAMRSSGSSFVTDTTVLSQPIKNQTVFFDNQLTSFTDRSVIWKLELNPNGLKAGCNGYGWMWYLM